MGIVSIPAVSVAGADVGGPPTNDVKRCDSHAKPCGKPFVLGEGRQFGGKREIVGLKSRLGACLSFERLGYESSLLLR